MRRFERTDDFLTLFAEDVADARRARRLRFHAMMRDFCALSAVSAFGVTVLVWAVGLSDRPVEFHIAASLSTDRGAPPAERLASLAADSGTVRLVSAGIPASGLPLKGGADK